MSGYNCEDEDICLFCSAMLLPLPQKLRKDTARNNDTIIIQLGNIYNTCKLSTLSLAWCVVLTEKYSIEVIKDYKLYQPKDLKKDRTIYPSEFR